MILVEQSFDFIRKLSDRVLVIQKGILVREVMPEQIAEVENEFIGGAVARSATKMRAAHCGRGVIANKETSWGAQVGAPANSAAFDARRAIAT